MDRPFNFTDDEFIQYLIDTYDTEELLDIYNIGIEELVQLLRGRLLEQTENIHDQEEAIYEDSD